MSEAPRNAAVKVCLAPKVSSSMQWACFAATMAAAAMSLAGCCGAMGKACRHAVAATAARPCRDAPPCAAPRISASVMSTCGGMAVLLAALLDDVGCVHQRQDAIQAHVLLDEVVCEEGLRHRGWVCETCGLDQHAIQDLACLLRSLDQLLYTCNEVAANRAADAAIVHLHDVLLRRELQVGEGFRRVEHCRIYPILRQLLASLAQEPL